MAECGKKKNMNFTKIILSVVIFLVGNVCTGFVTYFSTISSMKTEIALNTQQSEFDKEFIEFRLAKLESASPEKVDDGLAVVKSEIDSMKDDIKEMIKLLR